jgi:hypothetical protein
MSTFHGADIRDGRVYVDGAAGTTVEFTGSL